MSKKAKKWKARFEDVYECCLQAETDLRHEQQKFYAAQAEGARAQEHVHELEAVVESITEDRDYWQRKAAEERQKADEEITKLNNEQDAQWGRGYCDGLAHARGDTEEIPTVDVSAFAQTKSAIEVPKPVKDEGEGMLIAYTEALYVRPGDRIRSDDLFGRRFVTVLHAYHREGTRVDLTVRVPHDGDPSMPYGDHSLTLAHDEVVERNENP